MIIGIDLGTTNSLVAVWQDGAEKLIPNAMGETLTPSCVSLDNDGTVLIGRAARDRLQAHPEHSAANFKRYMGSDKALRLGDRDFRPEELSSLVPGPSKRIDAQLRGSARTWLGEQILQFEAGLATQDARLGAKARALLEECLTQVEREAAVLEAYEV